MNQSTGVNEFDREGRVGRLGMRVGVGVGIERHIVGRELGRRRKFL